MAIDVRMPKLSDNMEEGVIIRWMKAPGDQVAKGEPLAEVETDKADVELEAADSGVLREIKVAQGQSAAVGAVIAILAAPGETAEGAEGASDQRARSGGPMKATRGGGDSGPATGARGSAPQRSGPLAAAAAEAGESAAGASRAPGGGMESAAPLRGGPAARAPSAPETAVEHPVRASPLAWRLADEAGVNLATVRGSGPGGRIVKRDVEASIRGPAVEAREVGASTSSTRTVGSASTVGEAAVRPEPVEEPSRTASPLSERGPAAPARQASSGGSRRVEATRMRLAIATRMADAKREIPHFYVAAEIDMSDAMRLRESIKRREAMPGLTVTHLLLRALAVALVRHPRVNASWHDNAIELHDDVNIGIAVAVEDGLVVPVLHRAQTLTLAEIAARATALTDKARTGKFSGEELTGGTFSLSNVGMLDVDELVAVINPPQAAILAVAAVKERPIARDGQLAVAKTMRATLSCDHRVLNGVEGGRFLEELKGVLENPVTLLLE